MTRLLAGTTPGGSPLRFEDHRALHGALPPVARRGDPAALHQALVSTGVRGRGGAGFPAARKLAAAWRAGGKGTVIANGSEGEPASAKDRTLLALAPHLVLDGLQLAARAVEAREVVLALHVGSPVRAIVVQALAERDDRLAVRLLEVPDRYVSGEASSLAGAAIGGPALPVLHDQPLAVRGLERRPTVVLNVETLADLALLLLYGSAWYAAVGTPEEPGTALLTIRETGSEPAVLESPLGTPLEGVLATAGLDVAEYQAALVGGYFGSWLSLPEHAAVSVSHAGLGAVGGTLGAGVVMALRHDECGLRATAEAVRYLAGQSAGQCGPCLNGLPAIAAAFEDLVAAGLPATRVQLQRWCGMVTGRGLCHHPDGTVALVRSALLTFGEDVERHRTGQCDRPAGRALGVPLVRA